MTLHIFESTYRDKPCMKCVVRLSYKKDDKTRRCQKTYRAVGEVFKVRLEEVEVGFRAAAKRWEIETLDRIKNGQPPELTQEEISMSPPPEKIMKAHQYLYYVKCKPVWSDAEYDKYCKDNGLSGNGGSDLESSYDKDVVELADSYTPS